MPQRVAKTTRIKLDFIVTLYFIHQKTFESFIRNRIRCFQKLIAKYIVNYLDISYQTDMSHRNVVVGNDVDYLNG
jgi:hypothetical protein